MTGRIRAVVAAFAALGIIVIADARSRADVLRARPHVHLILDQCLDDASDELEQAARVELGDRSSGPDPIVVRVDCAAGGIDAGVVIDVLPPGSPRHYRYALDWRSQRVDVRSRLFGLAVAEAIDASQIELTAVPEPAVATMVPAIPAITTERVEPLSGWTIGLVGSHRSFADRAGVAMFGGGLAASRTVLPGWHVAIDAIAETQTVLVASGAIDVLSISSAPRVVYRVGERITAELGIGARIGVVRLHGETLPGDGPKLEGHGVVRAWLGPVATLAAGMVLSTRLAIDVGLEVGIAAAGSTATQLNEPAAVIDGRWLALGFTTTVAL